VYDHGGRGSHQLLLRTTMQGLPTLIWWRVAANGGVTRGYTMLIPDGSPGAGGVAHHVVMEDAAAAWEEGEAEPRVLPPPDAAEEKGQGGVPARGASPTRVALPSDAEDEAAAAGALTPHRQPAAAAGMSGLSRQPAAAAGVSGLDFSGFADALDADSSGLYVHRLRGQLDTVAFASGRADQFGREVVRPAADVLCVFGAPVMEGLTGEMGALEAAFCGVALASTPLQLQVTAGEWEAPTGDEEADAIGCAM